ncbi:unnamed protein product [Nesidiocoris tenuis]|uniref:Nuclear speckle splicing regulatory protein 1 N-terminal domain-containing protein n=1 Tax=Nesidiocoris tenuis TaxID=355587 RepID=A0A6H5G7U1_9HEMI|nr:unnamed protein product [Nesidiocoris tenuis]CAA9998466.1 unnamed protein product [Nesidiocoris tenuis]
MSASRRQAKVEVEKALKEDATVFQYDEIYDEIDQQKKSLSGANKPKDRKPKYVQNLLLAAERRKMENERRYERQVQKEREAEGEEFKDKETFVTSAYKKKLEEFAKLDAEQMRQDMLEEIGDVTKQPDISGFYRHLYQSTVGGEKPTTEQPQEDKDSSDKAKKSGGAGRQYRKRKDSHSSGDKNQDADSDLDSDSSSSSSSSSDQESGEISSHSDTEDPKRIRLKNNPSEKEDSKNAKNDKSSSGRSKEKHDEKVVKPTKKAASIEDPVVIEDEKAPPAPPSPKEPPPPPIDIWKKRTVGPVFDAALQRYLERKATRLSIGS